MRHFIIITQTSRYPQMGALYIANALLRHGIETHFLSSNESCEALDRLVEKFDPIAIGCSVMTAPEIMDFVRHSVHVQTSYNVDRCNIPVIWGGMHSTIVADQTAEEPYIDFVISGEAETTLAKVLKGFLQGEIPERKLIRVETPRELDHFSPHWDQVSLRSFLFPESHSVHADIEFHRKHIFYYLLSSRGCTYKCTFCWEVARVAALKVESPSGDLAWRAHSLGWMEQELDKIAARLSSEKISMDGIGLWDDMIFGTGEDAHHERAKGIFELMRSRSFGYLLEARANQLIKRTGEWNGRGTVREADLYQYLKETGCMQVFVGTESGNQATLNLIKKGTKVVDYKRLVELSREIELPLRFSMIVGFPGETEESIHDTLDLIESLKGEKFISVSGPKLFTPYPGTPQYVTAVQRGMRVPKDTLDWASLNRYSDYRSLFPWLTADYSERTLQRIDDAFEEVAAEKKVSVMPRDIQRSREFIYEALREH